jgi:hypothetical protein
MKPKGFSITVDTRKMANDTPSNLNELINNLVINKYVPSCFLTRLLLQDELMDYAGAFDAL